MSDNCLVTLVVSYSAPVGIILLLHCICDDNVTTVSIHRLVWLFYCLYSCQLA